MQSYPDLFEVERWPWLRSVFEEATRVSRLMISVTFTLMQYQVALRVEMLPLHWFEVRVWGFVIAPDGHSVNLYWVLILTDRPTTKALLKDGSTPDSHFNSVYRVLTLTTQTYTESLLNDGSTLDGHFYNLYQVLTWWLDRHRGPLKRRKSSWQSLWQPIFGPYPDG